MSDTTLLNNLAKLGYSKKWLENGVLTVVKLDEQLEKLYSSQDENLEHYRYNTLSEFIENRKRISNEELDI
jgi:hypothetical protein